MFTVEKIIKGFISIFKKKYVNNPENLDSWKVFFAKSTGSGFLGETVSEPDVGKPGTGHTQTFISFGSFKTEFEVKALAKYLKTKFARVMLGVKKSTQDNATKEIWSKVPLQNFGIDSDINWSDSIQNIDKALYKKYHLSKDEVEFIEQIAKPMD